MSAKDKIDAAMVHVERVLRADRRFLPRYSELAYVGGTSRTCCNATCRVRSHS